jgi:hypothetical protein
VLMQVLLVMAGSVVEENADDYDTRADATQKCDVVAENEDRQPDGDRALYCVADAANCTNTLNARQVRII